MSNKNRPMALVLPSQATDRIQELAKLNGQSPHEYIVLCLQIGDAIITSLSSLNKEEKKPGGTWLVIEDVMGNTLQKTQLLTKAE